MTEETLFKLEAPYQPQAIEQLVQGSQEGNQCQTLLGVTGSCKIFTVANVIKELNKPTLIIAHNKTLAAQLYGEFKEFFPFEEKFVMDKKDDNIIYFTYDLPLERCGIISMQNRPSENILEMNQVLNRN